MNAQLRIPANNQAENRCGVKGLLQRKCNCGGNCPKCREREQLLQRSAAAPAPSAVAPPIVHEVLRSPGQPLDAATRAFMEPRFGYDFSDVRVHTDQTSALSVRAFDAAAYTIGDRIVFAEGKFSPGTLSGRHLLAHELAHTIQQRGVQADSTSPLTIGSRFDPAEAQAERHARAVAAGGSIPSSSLPTAAGSGLPVLRRFSSPEHQDIGNRHLEELMAFLATTQGKEWAQQHGLDADRLLALRQTDPLSGAGTLSLRPEQIPQENGRIRIQQRELTAGDVIALMGDFTGSAEELEGMPWSRMQEVLQAIKLDRAGVRGTEERYQKASGGRYLELAQRNLSHFAPQNIEKWKTMHRQAITMAARSADSETQFQRALLLDAAAGHFLTDAFAGGHMFDAAEVLTAIRVHLGKVGIQTDSPEATQATRMAGLIPSLDLSLLVLKNIHDWLNSQGRMARNRKGMQWQAFGDEHLAHSAELQRVASLAVFTSRMQVVQARSGSRPDVNEVLDLLPLEATDPAALERITTVAIGHIPEAVRGLPALIHQNYGLLDTKLFRGASNILPIIENATDPGRMRQRELDQTLRDTSGENTPSVTVPLYQLRF